MKQEAESLNLINASFELYDGQNIPFEDNSFTKTMTGLILFIFGKNLLNY